MRYAVFAGGKRVRPALVLLGGELWGGARADLLPAAAALEMVHCFSLIHDDLPALDDDELRRGRPTVHRQFDEATAVLAGDALLNLAYEVLAREPEGAQAKRRERAQAILAAGVAEMIRGQAGDLAAEGVWPDDPVAELEWIHRRKTGALLAASLRLGAIYAGASEAEDAQLLALGHSIGLLFQIADDILDLEGSTATLGKTAGKDQEADKLTYPRVHGLSGAKTRLIETRDLALLQAAELPRGGGVLPDMLHYLTERDR